MTDVNGVPVIAPTPCRPYPTENVEYKTVGLDPCPMCKSTACWLHYLRWEKKHGITLNEAEHPADSLAIAQVPITLAPGDTIFELKLREPGIVRAVGFWLHEPKVLASAMKGVEKIPMPLLFVECDPHGALPDQKRVFVFLPSEAVFTPKMGWSARYVTTAIHPGGARHLFELVEVS